MLKTEAATNPDLVALAKTSQVVLMDSIIMAIFLLVF